MTPCHVLSAFHLGGSGRIEAGETVELNNEDFLRFTSIGCVIPLDVHQATLDAEAEVARQREAAAALAAEQSAELEAKARASVEEAKQKIEAQTAEVEKAVSDRDGPRSRRKPKRA